MKSQQNGECVCSHQFAAVVEEAVGCRDHPRASNLLEVNVWGDNWESYQGGAALGVDVILALILIPDQSCYPGEGIFLCKYKTSQYYL